MIERENDSLQQIDVLVGAYLTKRAAQIDAQKGLARVRSALAKPIQQSAPSSFRFKPASLTAGFAAAMALAFLRSLQMAPVQASALQLVQEVKRVHNLELERCYLVELKPIGTGDPHTTFLGGFRRIHVWTRGDRFWVEMLPANNDPAVVWGRDQDEALWAILDKHRGIHVASDQAPSSLKIVADIISLNVDKLLNDVLHGCTLVEDPSDHVSKLTRTVRATPHIPRTRLWLQEVKLEIDTEARVLRRLTLARNRLGTPFANLTFTLVETRPANKDKYQLEGWLVEPMHIYEGPVENNIRRELISRWLGARFGANAVSKQSSKQRPPAQAEPEPDLKLQVKAIDGTAYTPLATSNKKASVLLFLLPDCPICNASIPEINRICAEYEKRGVNVFVIHADPDVTAEEARKHAKDYRLPCPILLDPAHTLVERIGAKIAPEAAVLTPDGKTVYLGRINDLYFDYGKKRAVPQQHDLRNALDAVLTGKPVPAPLGKAIGCHIPPLDK